VVRGRIIWLAPDEPATKSSLNCQKCYVPAVGIKAAVNSRDFGTFRWQLNEKSYTGLPHSGRATNFRKWHDSEVQLDCVG
jgi:hypothetical protein